MFISDNKEDDNSNSDLDEEQLQIEPPQPR